jgi:uncharacterized protein YcbK (DUF882 family)
MAIGPSQHVTWAELACKDEQQTPYPEVWRTTRAVELATLFEAIRAVCGDQPLTIVSAYRTPAHNRAIGGALHSQHVEGRALDLRPPDGLTVDQFYKVVRTLHRSGGIGKYEHFVHVDVRPGDRLHVWNGGGQIKDDRA